MERNGPTALQLAATGSAWLVFIFPLFPGGCFVDGPVGQDHVGQGEGVQHSKYFVDVLYGGCPLSVSLLIDRKDRQLAG